MVAQPGLCGTWSETPKTGFLTSIYFTVKFLNFRTLENFAVINLKFKQKNKWSKRRVICLNDLNGMANSAGPDQTVPLGT